MQLCQICQQASAHIHTLDLEDEQWVQRHLCEKCALGASSVASPEAGNVIQFFGKILAQTDLASATSGEGGEGASGIQCQGCGLTYEQFQNNRRLGCARCYDVFASDLEQIFLRVQERAVHRGKVPGRPQRATPSALELRRLQEGLKRAVEAERFEEAARYRDQIRQLSESLEEGAET